MLNDKDSDLQAVSLIILTGGTRGLGLAFTESLLDAGYSVATCSRGLQQGTGLEALQGRYGNRLSHAQLDIGAADTDDIRSFVSESCKRHGVKSPYALINNAGVAREGVLATLPSIDIRHMVDTNLVGAIEITRAVIQLMLRYNSNGRIVNISSIIGSHGYNGLSPYAATKAALDGFTRSLARELGRRSITVNSISPGYIETEMSASLRESQRMQIIRRTPVGRLGRVQDIVPMLKFLLSKEAEYITGQIVTIDGGINA